MRTRRCYFALELFSAKKWVWETGPHVRSGENRPKTATFARTREETRILNREKCMKKSKSETRGNSEVRKVRGVQQDRQIPSQMHPNWMPWAVSLIQSTGNVHLVRYVPACRFHFVIHEFEQIYLQRAEIAATFISVFQYPGTFPLVICITDRAN